VEPNIEFWSFSPPLVNYYLLFSIFFIALYYKKMSGNCLGSVNVVTTFNSNFSKIISQLNTANPLGRYTIDENNRIQFKNISENTLNNIFTLDLDPNPYSGGSFITTIISDIQTNVNSNNTNDINAIQHYSPLICDYSSQEINYQTALSYNSVIQNVGTGALDLRYNINNGVSVGTQIDYATAPFQSQSTLNVQKLLSGSFISTTYTPPNASSILETIENNMGGGGRRVPARRVGGRMQNNL